MLRTSVFRTHGQAPKMKPDPSNETRLKKQTKPQKCKHTFKEEGKLNYILVNYSRDISIKILLCVYRFLMIFYFVFYRRVSLRSFLKNWKFCELNKYH